MTSKAQRTVFVGLQGSTGTPATVDMALHATCTLVPAVTKEVPDEDVGSFAPKRHVVTQIKPDGTLTFPSATYEEILVALAMAMGAPNTEGTGGNPYTWAWVLPDTVAKGFYLYTIEYAAGDSVGGNKDHVVRAVDAFGTGLTISGEAGGTWTVEVPLTGRLCDLPADVSANITVDDTVTAIRMAETTLWIDATYAGIGVTQCEELISFNYTLEGLHHSKQFAGSLYPNGQGSGKWKTTLELVLETSAPEAQAFEDAALTTTQYAVRIRGYVDANDSCVIDGMYMVEEVATLDDRDGNNTIKVTLSGEKDASENTGSVTVITDVSAL